MSEKNSDSKNYVQLNNNTNIKNPSQLNSNPSYQTILATDIPLTYSESDLYSIFSRYGSVNKIQKLSNLSCCLIEFSDSNASIALIQMSKYNAFYIGSHKIKLEYSSQPISPMDNKTTDNSTNILSINISNVKYPITVDIIKQICSKFGKLQRIFIGKKNSDNIVECLMEFDKISEAKAAKEALHGEDIYSGCCSLDVKYSKMSIVPVFKNDEESWDFTKSQIKPGILKLPPANGTAPSVTTAVPPTINNNNTTNNNNGIIFPANPPVYPAIYNYPPPLFSQLPINPMHHPPFGCRQPFDRNHLLYNMKKKGCSSSSSSKLKLEINKDAFVVEIGVVFIVYNLPFNMCVDHLFNLFCLYGNVHKVRFLPSQPGAAMVQMGSRAAADFCVQHYNGRVIFGQEMRLVKCSKPEIFGGKTVEFLPNGTPGFRDFSADSNNRFLNDHGINSNKILEPNRTLHFFNAPYTFGEADLSNMIIQSGVPRPINIIIFNSKSDQIKKCIGLFEFHRLEDALIALSVLNHKPIIIPDTNQVFHMKLTFSAREPKNTDSLKRCYVLSRDRDSGNEDSSKKKWKCEEQQREQEEQKNIEESVEKSINEQDDVDLAKENVDLDLTVELRSQSHHSDDVASSDCNDRYSSALTPPPIDDEVATDG